MKLRTEFIKPSLLEIGEEHQLNFMLVHPCGRLEPQRHTPYRIICSDPEIIGLNGSLMTGLKPGETEISVSFHDDKLPVHSWKVRVQPAGQASGLKMKDHPRILFSEEELRDFRERIKPGEGSPERVIDVSRIWAGYLAKADTYEMEEGFTVLYPSIPDQWNITLPLTEPKRVPEPEGHTFFPFWTMYSRAIEERLVVLSTVFLVTEEKKYAVRVKQHLLSLAAFGKWYEFDERGAEGNLSNAHLLIGMASAYDAIYSLLSNDERRLIRQAILEKGLQPLAQDIGSTDMHNIVAAKQVAMIYGAAAIMDEVPFAVKYLNAGLAYLHRYLDRKIVSGETEGLLYDNVSARHAWMASDLYLRISGDDSYVQHPYLREELPERFFRLMAPGEDSSFPNLSDSFPKLDIAYLMAMTATHYGHPAAVWYLQKHAPLHDALLLYLRKEILPKSPAELYGKHASAAFGNIGWAALRSGWSDKDHLLCFTASSSAKDHNHRDQNNLVINSCGEWLLTNPGYQDYVPGPKADYTTGTVGHNSLLVNDQGQLQLGGASFRETLMLPYFEVVSGDASESYGGLLKCYRRSIIHIESAYYVVVDDVELHQDSDKTELLYHTTSTVLDGEKPRVPGELLESESTVIQGEKSALQLIFALPEKKVLSLREYPGAESYGPYVTVGSSAGKRRRFIVVINPRLHLDGKLEVRQKKQNADSLASGLTVVRKEGVKDIWLFCADSAETDYQGITFLGDAARISGDGDMINLWKAKRLSSRDIAYEADLPLSVNIHAGHSIFAVHNPHPVEVSFKLRLPSGLEVKQTAPPGCHEWSFGHISRGGQTEGREACGNCDSGSK
ncbi:heparinase II/III domain-containing protein [Paenibacillus dakarensis]|uniref:heparinase II/III domain-containing protein n=1 Tax=Paenibacillus dakarensis TaxID=1527293 RepID=UPI0006D531C0|nr:heparinase II/III family protein [Paenibacillus dakarensis]